MDEVLPGILHWTTFHDGIGQTVHSHLHTPSGAIFDPRLPEGGVEALSAAVVPTVVLLSNRHHLRHAAEVAAAYDLPIRVSSAGLDDLAASDAAVTAFEPGDEVAEGVSAYALPALTPEETVFRIPSAAADTPAAVLFADTLTHHDGELAYMPDALLGDDPEAVRIEMTAQLSKLLETAAPFDTLLFAHGNPVPAGGHALLTEFVAAQHG
ncbi:MAG: hypothetical protein J7513_17590 [Solirubrobacteraceae bacterium]|nr:hypothetical protein [Solirubrobacteraceae bacterium]